MPTRYLARSVQIAAIFLLLMGLRANSQQNSSDTSGGNTVEGTVASVGRETLVVRTDENQFQLFTYAPGAVNLKSVTQGARVRVTAGPADENGTRTANDVTVLSASAAGGTGDKGASAVPVPPKVRSIESEIKRESRRWRLGVEAGTAFDPELFLFGVQSQMGPIFHPRVMFRPNAEFAFGEVTDLIALNFEAVYRLRASERRGEWTPFMGAGPSMTFIHQNFEKGRQVDFGNFDYETGFNILAGMQSRRGTFVELKTSLWSQPAPTLRLIVGYTF
jgi:hypothetical protein